MLNLMPVWCTKETVQPMKRGTIFGQHQCFRQRRALPWLMWHRESRLIYIWRETFSNQHIGELMLERRNSIVNALELRLCCIHPSICQCLGPKRRLPCTYSSICHHVGNRSVCLGRPDSNSKCSQRHKRHWVDCSDIHSDIARIVVIFDRHRDKKHTHFLAQ